MNTMLILGATSDMARATALKFAREGWNLLLAGRNLPEMEAIAQDLRLRTGREVCCLPFDVCDVQGSRCFWDKLPVCPEAVLCAVGCLEDQTAVRHDMALAEQVLCVNFTGLVPVLSDAAKAFEKRGSGSIIGISSVAGDRGRASNYVYGAAKAGMSTFLSGLRQRLAPKGVHVMTVKPGFVVTRMTEGMPLPPLLTATPQTVAQDIFAGMRKRKYTIYSRWFWRWIMNIVRMVPEVIFCRLKM